jgi:predicted RNA binding protein YcfA (HicA-like mRNA interferase family)
MRRNERDLRRLARSHGWTIERTNGGYWRLRHPVTGAVVIAAATPGDSGWQRVIAGCLRRAGRHTAQSGDCPLRVAR